MLLILVQVQQEGEKGEKEIEMTEMLPRDLSRFAPSLKLTFDFRNQKIPTALNNKGNHCLT